MLNYGKRLGREAALTTAPEVEAAPPKLKKDPREEEVTLVPMTKLSKQHALDSTKSMMNLMTGTMKQKRSSHYMRRNMRINLRVRSLAPLLPGWQTEGMDSQRKKRVPEMITREMDMIGQRDIIPQLLPIR